MPAGIATMVDVLIVGAGPTGLTVAISLLSSGRSVTVVDDHEEGDNTSRAAVVFPATLEMLDRYGIAQRLAAQGIHTPRFTIRDRDRVLTPVPFDKLPTAFPYALLISQAVTEAVLLEKLKQLGGRVLRPRTVTQVNQDDAGASVTFASGEQMRAAFVVGADGAHSTVREQVRIDFIGDNTGASYSLADVHLTGGVRDDELVVYFSPAGHLVVLPLPGGIHRIVANVAEAPEDPDLDFLQQLLDTRGPSSERAVVHDVVWGSRFLTRPKIRLFGLSRSVDKSFCKGALAESSRLGGRTRASDRRASVPPRRASGGFARMGMMQEGHREHGFSVVIIDAAELRGHPLPGAWLGIASEGFPEFGKFYIPGFPREHSISRFTRVNAEQSSKRTMRRPTRQPFRGRLIRLGEQSEEYAQPLRRGSGDRCST